LIQSGVDTVQRKSYVANRVLMVRPRSFRANEQTMATNRFQVTCSKRSSSPNAFQDPHDILTQAQAEFDLLHKLLVHHGVAVDLQHEPVAIDTPDALFPNNWFAILPGGTGYLFPMMAANRRREVHPEWIETHARHRPLEDLRHYADEGEFLEGTGSLILDHNHKMGYACRSPRTSSVVIDEFERRSGYRILRFSGVDAEGSAFYHTNVMMALGHSQAVVCLEGIRSTRERDQVIKSLKDCGFSIVDISLKQVSQFAGNLLFLESDRGTPLWVMSTSAFQSFLPSQKDQLLSDGVLVHSPLATIEAHGGGSARCMLAELF
jgi:hypothetical protein